PRVGVVPEGPTEPIAEKIAANMMTTTTIPTIIGSSGIMAHALDICLSLSSRVRRSRLRFSSGMLNWGLLLDRSFVRFFYLRQWSFVPIGQWLSVWGGCQTPRLASL